MVSTLILAKENRVMIENLQKNIEDLGNKIEEAFDHMSSRLPMWATILFTILGSLVTGLIAVVVKS